ncbi:S26 family signal peptidase [Streptomyces tritici]|uniref:S26 family signal peptidase n=1 Tax=Streptomyces tritici TaxID=2054410 RepID=UPI003AF0AC18
MLVVGAAIAVVRIRTSVVVVSVRGDSMAPALRDGDRVVVRRRPLARVRRGDVVVLKPPPTSERDGGYGTDRHGAGWNVKRVTALPGDPAPEGTAGAAPGERVPADALVVRGDNPDSIDSRHRGYYPGGELLGTVVRRLGERRTPAA